MTPAELHALLTAREEFALLDAREEGTFSKGHLFHANCVPLSLLELQLDDLVPRRATTMVWCSSADDGLAERAATRSRELGWTAVTTLEGGLEAWGAAGFEIYAGVNVPSKAFGEFVEHTYDTPRIPAAELAALLDSDDPPVVLDSRPVREYQRMSIPTGVDCPGAELVHRVRAAAPDPDALVVVNCAGRTRSIIGAQSLINAGVPNRVVALENGTMGWELAGLTAARGATDFAPEPDASSRSWSAAAAGSVAERFGVETIDSATMADWLADDARTTYLFDVRTPGEFEAGHVRGARHAEGGQLVQATDEYVATRNARIVLTDDDGVRATMTASWLRQLGWDDAVVLDPATAPAMTETGAASSDDPSASLDASERITVDELAARQGEGSAVILDLNTSLRFRDRGHVPGSWWAVRSRLDQADAAVAGASTIVLTAPDDGLAVLARADAAARWPDASVKVLVGGKRAWEAAGHELEFGIDRATTTLDDVWYKPYDFDDPEIVEREMQGYLTWEVALVEQLAADPTVSFPTFD